METGASWNSVFGVLENGEGFPKGPGRHCFIVYDILSTFRNQETALFSTYGNNYYGCCPVETWFPKAVAY